MRGLAVVAALAVSVVGVTAPSAADAAAPTAVTATVGDAASGRLRVSMSVSTSPLPVAHVTVENLESAAVSILTWGSPLDPVASDSFDVSGAAGSVAYSAAVVKRSTPSAADYRILAPGAAITADVELARSYAIRAAGAYSLVLDSGFADVRRGDIRTVSAPPGAMRPVALALPATTFDLALSIPAGAATEPVGGGAAFTGCSPGEQTAIDGAVTSARLLVADARARLELAANPVSAARSTTWFGAHTPARYATAQAHFVEIDDFLALRTVADIPFSCNDIGCSPSTYAYVFPSDPTYTIHLCGEFFSAPNSGADSKPGVLVHEVSHFTTIAGTDDYVYGTVAAAALAASNPELAIMNADNHEYFVENPTNLSMGNLRPTAQAQSVAVEAGSSTPITLIGSDLDSDPIDFVVASGPSHGSLSGTGSSLVYTPSAPYANSDSFTFVANDGQVSSSPATVDIAISSSNLTTVSVGSATIVEGDTGTSRSMSFAITLSAPVTALATVGFDVVGAGTASVPGDVTFRPGTVQFKPSLTTGVSKTTAYATVKVVPDVLVEGDETFSVVLSNPTGGIALGAASGLGTIVDDDPAPAPGVRVSIGDAALVEGDLGINAKATNNAKLYVSLSAPALATYTVQVEVTVGSATAGTDIKKVFVKTLTFKPGQVLKPVVIGVLPDLGAEGDETVMATLTNPTGGVTMGRFVGTLTIVDDD